jgi:methionine synthase II (cobalamin-independent)
MSTTLDGFCHRMVRVRDVNIHAVIGGDGPPLVLLHGFPQTWWAWRKMMPLLAVKRTAVAVDLRGASIESSRSEMELLEAFRTFKYPNEVGPGLYDIHSPRVPSVDEMIGLLKKGAPSPAEKASLGQP